LGALSPDGRWFACLMVVDDGFQVRIYSFPNPGARYQLVLGRKVNERTSLTWSGDGRTLVVVDSDQRVIAVPVQLEGGFQQGEPRLLFTLPPRSALIAASPDLHRFLVSEAEPQTNPAPLCVLTSWPARLAKR
jgi:hypothetical protein